MKARSPLAAGAILALVAMSACASRETVQLSSSFAPAGNYPWAHTPRKANTPPVCSASVGDVTDARSDTQTMGHLGGRFVKHDDTIGWLRSGFETLSMDKRIRMVEAANVGDGFVLNVALLKSYMESPAMAKSATVVVRVSYAKSGTPIGEKIFRGDHTEVNWGSGDNEARDSLNRALQEVIAQTHDDLLERCIQGSSSPPARPVATS